MNNVKRIKSIKSILSYILAGVFFTIAFALLFSQNVMAYIDPSVMTYAIQAVTGIVIAIGAVVGIFYRKMKKKVNDKLDIDENKNKEVESDDIEIISKEEEK